MSIVSGHSQKLIFKKNIGEETKDFYNFSNLQSIQIVDKKIIINNNHKYYILDSLGNLKCKFGGLSDNSNFNTYTGNGYPISTTKSGEYVVGAGQFYGLGIKIYSARGTYIRTAISGNKILIKGERLFNPKKIVHWKNQYFILDISNNNIKVFNDNWLFEGVVSIDKNNNYYIEKPGNYKYSKDFSPLDFYFNSKGELILINDQNEMCIFYNSTSLKSHKLNWMKIENSKLSIDKNNIYIYNGRNDFFNTRFEKENFIFLNPKLLDRTNSLNLNSILDFVVDENNIYIIPEYQNIVYVFDKKSYLLKRKFDKNISNDQINLHDPIKISSNQNKNKLLIEDKTTNYKSDYLEYYSFENKIIKSFLKNKEVSFLQFWDNNKYIGIDCKTNKLVILNNKFTKERDFAVDFTFHEPIKLISQDSILIVIDYLKNKNCEIFIFDIFGNLINRIDKINNKDISYCNHVDFITKNDIWISYLHSLIHVDGEKKVSTEIDLFGYEVHKHLKIGIIESDNKLKLAINNSNYNYLPESIIKFKIYEDKIFLCDSKKLLIISKSGQILSVFPFERGYLNGEINGINDFEICDGLIYINDAWNHRISVFKLEI